MVRAINKAFVAAIVICISSVAGALTIDSTATTTTTAAPPSSTANGGQTDLSGLQKLFPPGNQSGMPILDSQWPKGPYPVSILSDKHFPGRTIYVPQGAVQGPVPILAWENGICYKYGKLESKSPLKTADNASGFMYSEFLSQLASYGYLVVTPGQGPSIQLGYSSSSWQRDSITMAQSWNSGNLTIARDKVAAFGHSCGGEETAANIAVDKRITTAMILSGGSAVQSTLKNVNIPLLYVHGGPTDVAVRIRVRV
jgi:hypothetical protein